MTSFSSRLSAGLSTQELEQRVRPLVCMMFADNQVSDEERLLLRLHLQVIGVSAERWKAILESSELPSLPERQEHQIELLLMLAGMMVCDGKVTPMELKLFTTLANAMDFTPAAANAALLNAVELARNNHPGVNIAAQIAEAARANIREMQRS